MQEGLSLASTATAFAAGLISVASPCVMPLMPAYLSLISGVSVDQMREADLDAALRRRILHGCIGFVLGLTTVFVLLGATATAVGGALATWRIALFGLELGAAQLAGLVIIVMGLHLMEVLPIPFLQRDARYQGRIEPRSVMGTFLIGAAFAFGWTPCVGPILGGILTLASAQETVGRGMALLAVYSAGLAIPFLLAGLSLDVFLRGFARLRRHLGLLQRASGAVLVIVGLLVVTNRLSRLNAWFGFLNDWVAAAESLLL